MVDFGQFAGQLFRIPLREASRDHQFFQLARLFPLGHLQDGVHACNVGGYLQFAPKPNTAIETAQVQSSKGRWYRRGLPAFG